MAIALGGLALVVAARGGEQSGQDEVIVDNPTASEPSDVGTVGGGSKGGGSAWPGLTGGLQDVAGPEAVRLLDFQDIDQPGTTCPTGGQPAPAGTIAVDEGTSELIDPGGFVRVEVDGAMAYGDLDDDGSDEAVVHAVCAFGANGALDRIQIWDLDAGRPQVVASTGEPPAGLSGPFPPAVKDAAVDGGDLLVTWTHYAEGDPNCCPSGETQIRYQLEGNQLTAVGDPQTSVG